jgi:hypothetical protein
MQNEIMKGMMQDDTKQLRMTWKEESSCGLKGT